MATWGTNGRKFFSEYGPDGTRFCMLYSKPERDPRAQRAQRNFGPRKSILREDTSIPDGVCNPEQCPQYQSRQCNLSARFIFAIPEIKGLGLIELPTNSIYVLQKAYSAMQTVALARGKLTGTHFWMSKREFDITRINETGEAVRQKQMLTVLDADIDISALLDGADDHPPGLAADEAAMLLEGGGGADANASPGSVHVLHQSQPAMSGESLQAVNSSVNPGDDDEPPAVTDHEETFDEKRDRMSDLLQRLGLNAEARQRDFRIFAHSKYGRGWTQRATDVDGMNGLLAAALEDRAPLDHAIEAAVRDAVFQ
jgi:hypothetical protein